MSDQGFRSGGTAGLLPGESLLLLLLSGLLLAINVNLSKAGLLAGLTPTQIASAGSGGAGFTTVLFALSPVVTYALACAVRMARLDTRGVLGLSTGLAGALILVAPGVAGAGSGSLGWMLVGLTIPLALATGNILRTRLVPAATPSRIMAAGVLLAASGLLAPLALATPTHVPVAPRAAGIVGGWAIGAALSNVAVFRLQRLAGPVMVSQVGYVSAAFGILIAVAAFGERLSVSMIVAVGLIVAGIRLLYRRATPADEGPVLSLRAGAIQEKRHGCP